MVMTVVPFSCEPGRSCSVLVTGTAARMGAASGYSPCVTARARATASAWTDSGSPSGLRCTTETRLSSGKPNFSNERTSLRTAALSVATSWPRSLPPWPMAGR
ncbi:hypothetical protein ACFQZ4_01720 [Catellatospora coxensis]